MTVYIAKNDVNAWWANVAYQGSYKPNLGTSADRHK